MCGFISEILALHVHPARTATLITMYNYVATTMTPQMKLIQPHSSNNNPSISAEIIIFGEQEQPNLVHKSALMHILRALGGLPLKRNRLFLEVQPVLDECLTL